jgi:hypothetical protein
MNPVCFRRTTARVLLVSLVRVGGVTRFGAVVEHDHGELPLTARAGRRRTSWWRELLPSDPGLVAVLRLTVLVLAVTLLLGALR